MPEANDPKKKAGEVKDELKEIRDITSTIQDGFRGITEGLQDLIEGLKEVSKESRSFDTLFKETARSVKSLSKGTEDLIKNQIKINQGSIKSNDIQKQINDKIAKQQVLQSKISQLQKVLDEEQQVSLEERVKLQSKINELQNEYNVYIKEGVEELEKQRDIAKQIEKDLEKHLGLTGKLFKGVSGFLEKMGVSSTKLQEINEKLRDTALTTKNSYTVMGVAIKETFKAIGGLLLDPLFLLGIMVKLFKELKDIAFSFSARTSDIAKSFAVTSESALLLNKRFSEIAGSSNNILVTQKSLLQATKDINERYGTNAMLTQEILTGQIELTDKLGLQGAEASAVTEYSLKTGKSQAQIVESITKQNKGILNNRKVLEATLKVGGQLYAQYKGDVEQIAKAVVQAQKLGLTLEETSNISRSLLNFESSISAELEAELLTGQDLNLEKARYLALQGKSAEAAAELLKNLGPNGLNKFMNMNVLQQDALAKALGMTSDQLANSLRTQQAISKLSSQDKLAYKEAINLAQAKGDFDRASALEKEMNQGKEFKMAQLNLDAQTKFNKAVEKMKALLVSVVEGPLGKMAEKITGMLEAIVKNPFIKEALKVAIPVLGALTGATFIVSLVRSLTGLFTSRVQKVFVVNNGVSGMGGGGGGGRMGTGFFGGPNVNAGNLFKGGRAGQVARGRFLRSPGGAGLAGLGIGIGGSILGDAVGGMAGGAISGAASGAGLGMMFGPWGALIGGLLGGAYGALTAEPEQVKDAQITPGGLIAAKYSAGGIRPIAQGLPNDNIYFSTNKSTANNNSTINVLLAQLIAETKLTREENAKKQQTVNVTVDNTPTVGTQPIIYGIKNTYKTGYV